MMNDKEMILVEWDYEANVTPSFFKDTSAAYDVVVKCGSYYKKNDCGAWYVFVNRDGTFTVQGDDGAKVFEPCELSVANPLAAAMLYDLGSKFRRILNTKGD